jgi:hypothetical protein
MAILYVTDFTSQGTDPNGKMQSSAQVPWNQTQTITISAVSAQTTNAVSNSSTLVRLHNDATGPCNINFGTNPTAIANSGPRLAANQTEYFTVPMNSGFKVAVITATV